MTTDGFMLFDTSVGACGIAWNTRGIGGVQLPEGSAEATLARMRRRFPGATQASPPDDVQCAIEAIVRLLRGEPADLSTIVLDMGGVPPFNRAVYDVTRRIPPGRTLTYGQVAERVGSRGAARAVGQALGRNPFAIVVPCHRVLGAASGTGGFSAAGGVATKRRLLAIEGVDLPGGEQGMLGLG